MIIAPCDRRSDIAIPELDAKRIRFELLEFLPGRLELTATPARGEEIRETAEVSADESIAELVGRFNARVSAIQGGGSSGWRFVRAGD